jgi:hypothetical protein
LKLIAAPVLWVMKTVWTSGQLDKAASTVAFRLIFFPPVSKNTVLKIAANDADIEGFLHKFIPLKYERWVLAYLFMLASQLHNLEGTTSITAYPQRFKKMLLYN